MDAPTLTIPSATPMGKRATNKADKLRRIRDAARGLFQEKGYDQTTLRDIAARGKVGFGTIFDYASNKRDLLFLIYNPEAVIALQKAHAAALAETGLPDRLMALFGGFYELHLRERAISRFVLRELNFFSDSTEAAQFLAHRANFFNHVAQQVEHARSTGEIVADAPVDSIAQALFAIYAWEVRRWLATDAPDLAAGLTLLRNQLALVLAGVASR